MFPISVLLKLLKYNMRSLILSWEKKGKGYEVLFPLLPETMNISNNTKNKAYEIQGLGEVTVLNQLDPKSISFESTFPANYFPGCIPVSLMKKPSDYITEIEGLCNDCQPALLQLRNSTGIQFTMLVSVEAFSYSESGGAVGDIDYSIEFKEYKAFGTKKIVSIPKTHTVKKSNESFASIAKKYYGSTSKKTAIAKYNKMKVGAKLKVGKKVKLP